RGLSVFFALIAQAGENLFEQSQRPLLSVKLFGREIGCRQLRVVLFGGFVEGDHLVLAAPLFGLSLPPFIRQEMLQGSEQEGTELSLFGVDGAEVILFQHPGEEFLGQILRFVDLVTAVANESVEGIPVGAAEILQGSLGLRGVTLAGSQYHGPLGGGEGNLLTIGGSRAHALSMNASRAKGNADHRVPGRPYCSSDLGTNASRVRLAMSKPSASSFWPACRWVPDKAMSIGGAVSWSRKTGSCQPSIFRS